MVNTHRKGSKWRRDVEVWLQDRGWSTRFRSIGEPGDDITAKRFLPATAVQVELSIECKNHKSITLAEFVDQAVGNADLFETPVVFVKRRGRGSVDDAYVVMRAVDFGNLIEEVGE